MQVLEKSAYGINKVTMYTVCNLPDQCENRSLCPCTAVICCHCRCKCYYGCAVCVLLCIRKCWKYRHPYVQLIQIITLGHQRSKRQKGNLTDMSHCLFSTLQSGNYLSPVHWSTQKCYICCTVYLIS